MSILGFWGGGGRGCVCICEGGERAVVRSGREGQRDPGGVIWNDVMIGGTLALKTFNFYFILFYFISFCLFYSRRNRDSCAESELPPRNASQ